MKLLNPTIKDLGGLFVKRHLPHSNQRMVGPFIFYDHFGPKTYPAGPGIDVRPHPHIGLATLTYLFEGSIYHQDSLGNKQEIRPGDVNWMVSGKGIVHSERERPENQHNERTIHGIQSWVALPEHLEEIEPSFHHLSKNVLPVIKTPTYELSIIAGNAFGQKSPVPVYSDMFYVDVVLKTGAILNAKQFQQELACHVIDGSVRINDEQYQSGDLITFSPQEEVLIKADSARCLLFGGAPLGYTPHLYWNFVSSQVARIEAAKTRWKNQAFGKIEGDDEFIPLPSTD